MASSLEQQITQQKKIKTIFLIASLQGSSYRVFERGTGHTGVMDYMDGFSERAQREFGIKNAF